MAWTERDELVQLSIVMGLRKGLRLCHGMRRQLTEDEQRKVAMRSDPSGLEHRVQLFQQVGMLVAMKSILSCVPAPGEKPRTTWLSIGNAAMAANVFVTERGSSFGYNNLVVDMRSLAIMRKFAPVVFDATHSVQLPSASPADEDQPAVSGGQPEFIPVLSRAAVAAGVDGVFMEVHDNPKEAKSDGANALDSRNLRGVLKELLAVRKAVETAHQTP